MELRPAGRAGKLASGRVAAAQYAAVLAQLLPAALAAGIPLGDIYVPATGRLSDGSSWIADLYAAQPCLGSNRRSCAAGAPPTPIAGWNIHPYGLPGMSSEGIDSLPLLRSEMRSGQNNIVASEIGFCDREDDSGNTCGDNIPDIARHRRTGRGLADHTLDEALPDAPCRLAEGGHFVGA